MSSSEDPWKYFIVKADRFLRKTSEHALQGINPGGYYHAIWCRDAAYILRDWFLSGNTQGVLQQIYLIWSHQIHKDQNEKIVYGRGSPERDYSMSLVEGELRERFFGALPTTIYQAGYCEIYGENPDIDSTALMISTTSWILANLVHTHESERHFQLPLVPIIALQGEDDETNADPNASKSNNPSRSAHSHKRVNKSNNNNYYEAVAKNNNPATDFSHLLDFTIVRMLKAVDYLSSRDIDNDGLLEQNHNEDWMDTVLRAGKIVYSQASSILALSNLASLLEKLKGYEKDIIKVSKLARRTIQGVEQNLWSEEDGAYIDIQETHHIGGPYRTLTQ
ncbi:MAG: hypothetical protein M3247_00530, partial [Thermoproteota archaeon]|nr:hypothetical protein [Thermoproteota archaeon]